LNSDDKNTFQNEMPCPQPYLELLLAELTPLNLTRSTSVKVVRGVEDS